VLLRFYGGLIAIGTGLPCGFLGRCFHTQRLSPNDPSARPSVPKAWRILLYFTT
jgi:hypothetical protein